ncbi:MAG: PAS domain-containing sensor histidine kinase [Campylobacterota bacterium]|nr:PAS domain-containing sensor histidine kinase [Campylobacterota bacterium]
MKNLTIKEISLYGFLIILLGAILSGIFIFTYLNKIETLNHKYDNYEVSYSSAFEFKHYSERLLTTTDLPKEKKLWLESKDKLNISISNLKIDGNKQYSTIIEFWKVIDSESKKIDQHLKNKLFSQQNIQDKSILRRLGEGLNSNLNSDYYLAIVTLKNSIDYLQQYEEFLLDEIYELKQIEQNNIFKKIDETKTTGYISFIFIIILAILFINFILKLISKVEKDLLETKDNLQDTLDESTYILNASMESIMIASDNHCIDVNEETLRTFGYENKDELIGQPTTIFISPESLELAQNKQNLDITKPYEAICIKKDSTTFPAIIQAYNFINKKGKTVRVSAMVDLTDIKEKDEALFEQSKMASMGEMLENIAHQWRQPLSVITTASSGIKLQKDYDMLTDEMLLNSCDQITNSAQHLSDTIDDFRDFYKDNKKKEVFNIKDSINKAIELLASKFKNRNIEVIVNTDDLDINGHKNELIQVFMNILNNSKDVLDEKEQKKKLILISTKKTEHNIVISINDNGGGIPQNIIPKIFDHKFTTKGSTDGTGIGLYMSKLIIEKAQGRIVASNTKFEYEGDKYTGAYFAITLPLS